LSWLHVSRRNGTANITAYPVGAVSIPAELTSNIRPERVHRGDPVEFREPVLTFLGIGNAGECKAPRPRRSCAARRRQTFLRRARKWTRR